MIAWKKWLLALCCTACAWSGALAQDDGDWIDRLSAEKDWVRWVDGLGRPETVQKLYIKNQELLDTTALRTFHNLTGLIIVDSPLSNLDFLKYFPELTVFECQGNKLRSLEGIQVLTKAEAITVKSNFVTNVHPLDSLVQLKMLNLSENDIKDIGSLAHFENITHFDISKNRIQNIEALRNWNKLEFLSLYSCYDLKNVDPVADLRKLTQLNLSLLDLEHFSLSLLDSLPKLEFLHVQGIVKSNEEVALLAKHTGLLALTMGRNDEVSDLSPLASLTKLEYLDIHSNNVSNISVVSYFPKLVKLVMYKNKVSDLRPLGECLELKSLFIFENPIENYDVLYDLIKLQHLHVNKADFNKEKAMELMSHLPDTKILFQ